MKKYGFIVVLLAAALIAAHLPAQAGITDGLVGYWKFDEGVGITAADASIEVYPAQTPKTATLFNGTVWVDGKIGKALAFDGIDGYASISAGSEINKLGQLTFATWMYTEAPAGYLLMSNKRFILSDTVNNPLNLRFNVWYSSSDIDVYSTNNSFPLNEWVHVAVTWDGTALASGVHMYVNGVETPQRWSGDGAGARQTSSTLLFGKYSYATVPAHYLNGSLDEVVIYNRALSASEIQELYTLNSGGSSIPLAPINSAPV